MPPKTSAHAKEKPKKSTVAGHQGNWVPMSMQLVTNPIWSNKKVPSNAWRVYWWLTNRMTGNLKYEDDPNIYGMVAGANPVSFTYIASDLHCSWSSVQRSVEWLVTNGMVARGRDGKGQEYRYLVIDSIREFELEIINGTSSGWETGTADKDGSR